MKSGVMVTVGTVVVFLGGLALRIGFVEALIGAVVMLVVGTVLTFRRKDRIEKKSRPGEHRDRKASQRAGHPSPDLSGLGISEEEFNRALSEGARKLAMLKRASDGITDQRVRGKAYGVCDSVARILSTIREDPNDLRPARKFLDYYLDTTINVVERYVALSAKQIRTAELESTLRRVEDTLDTINSAYNKQLTMLLENDVMELDVELKVLERTIRMEGLNDQ